MRRWYADWPFAHVANVRAGKHSGRVRGLSWHISLMERFAGIRYLLHESGRRLQVPIGACGMDMTEIGTEGREVASNRIVVVPALLERTDREGVPHIVHARTTLTGLSSQPDRSGQSKENGVHRYICHPFAQKRNEQRTIKNAELPTDVDVDIQGPLCRWVQGNQVALMKLGLPDYQAVFSHVLKLHSQGLGNAQSCRGDKSEERCVHQRPDRTGWT